MSNRLRRFAVLASLAVVTAIGPSLVRSSVVTAVTKLTDLRGVEELRSLFNHDKGKVRLLLLVSPT